MSAITSLTRMWLTRSVKPFVFTKEYDQQLSFENCQNPGLYVHIPFCRSICNFYYHYYENFYTLAYIDKMWGIMRTEAFPERIEL